MAMLNVRLYENVGFLFIIFITACTTVSSDQSDVEWLIRKLQNISYGVKDPDEDVTVATDNPVDRYKNQIPNVTCITEKYGTGYQGTKDTTHDGVPCIEWRRNLALYTRYKLRGKNITKNYCRNPDNDVMGPWCFVERRTIIKKQFKFSHCGINLCVGLATDFLKNFEMGVPMLLHRNCPKGFKMNKDKYCVVEPEFLDKLPNGSYSLQPLGNKNDSICYAGFKEEHISNRFSMLKNVLCKKESQLNGSIEFPSYISPDYEDLIFMAISPTSNCPSMMSETSLVIKMTKFFKATRMSICYYFYKLSKNKYSEDKRLAILTFRNECLDGWTLKNMENHWKFVISAFNMNKFKPVYACVPNNDISEYPDGNYCLLSFSDVTSSVRCPKDFIKVTVGTGTIFDCSFCCRQSNKGYESNINVFKFFNFSSVLIINNGNDCKKDVNESDIQISSFKFEPMNMYRKFNCVNCDLVKVFTYVNYTYTFRRFTRTSFTACNYERIINGFAYASINSRCPPEMEYAYVKYSTKEYLNYRKLIAMVKFCSKVNYPANISFPNGKYCIYKIGSKCPTGFVNSKEALPLFLYKISESTGFLPNYNYNAYCCKFGPKSDSFENVTLPYMTSNFEFGLPFPNRSYSCVHGLSSHTGVEDSHMCEYYPRTTAQSHTTIVFLSDRCSNPSYTFYGPYRLIYSANVQNRYCYIYVENNPPVGKYCVIFVKNCPQKYFYYVTYHPLSRGVICCRKNVSEETQSKETSFTLSSWFNNLKEFHLLPYKGQCEIFKGYNYGKRRLRISHSYISNDLNADHKKNLTDIGIKITKVQSNTAVWIESCLYKKDPFNKSSIWPHGNYAFPKTLMNCPPDFKTGYFTHSMESASPSFAHSDTIHLDGDYMIGGSKIKWGFCVKKDKFTKERLDLPYGRYCLMQVGSSCPIGFKSGSVKFVEITAINNLSIQRKGDLPEIETDGPFITYHFCCQSGRGDIAHEKINFPVDSGPFYLFKFGTYCQEVEGKRFTEEFICIDSEDSAQHLNYTFNAPYKVDGFTPITGSYSRGCDFQINLCYYDRDSSNSQISTINPIQSIGWPRGSYVFLKALRQKCPPLFVEGRIAVYAKFKIDQKFLNILMFGGHEDKEMILSYCERSSKSTDSLYPPGTWPKGIYCVIFEKKCPEGMLRHKFKSMNNFVFSMAWENLCCKKDNLTVTDDLPSFPADQYSFLILPTQEVHTCPAHKNMRVALINLQSEILCYYEKKDETVELPDGDYLFPAPWKPGNRCSPGFKLVEHYHKHFDGKDGMSKPLQFCQKENSGLKNSKFPRGNYCILTTNSQCPSPQFTEENTLVIPLHHFAEQKDKLSRYLACCQNDDHLISNFGDMKVPFQMYGSSLCSYVDGMVNANEAEESTILLQQGISERPPYIKETNKLRLCRYDQASMWNYDSRCQCHQNAACFLTFDDVKCRCKPGFFGNGKTICSKVTNSTDRCGNVCISKKSKCVGTTNENIYKCRCKEGYEGDGFTCRPSCNTRVCNVFSHCIVNNLVSYCDCLPNAVRVGPNSCNGDLMNTISLLTGFDYLNKINMGCFKPNVMDHLISPNFNQTLFIVIPSRESVFSKCFDVDNHYGLANFKLPSKDIPWSKSVQTEDYRTILISVDEQQNWTVNSNIKPFKVDIFTNAIVLYLNESFLVNHYDGFHHKDFISKDYILARYSISILVAIILISIAVVLIVRRKRLFGFNRLRESRSETNIHFFSSENKIEIDS